MQIPQQNPQRIPDPPIRVAEPREHLFRERHVVRVIDAADPEPHDIGAMFRHEMAGVHRLAIAARLRNFLAVNVDHESVRDARLVRRAIVQRDARHE